MPIITETYTPEPVSNQALLDNFARLKRYLIFNEGSKKESLPAATKACLWPTSLPAVALQQP